MSARRGFTLVEVCITVAVVGVLAAVAVPYLGEVSRRAQVNAATRKTIGVLRDSRAQAIAQRSINGARMHGVGVRILSETSYAQYADPDDDDANGNEIILLTVNLSERSVTGLRITAPAVGSTIRFRRDGGTTATRVVLHDDGTRDDRTITLTSGGQSRLE